MMYATPSLLNDFVQTRSITRTFWTGLCVLAFVVAGPAAGPHAMQPAAMAPAHAPSPAANWRESTSYVALFAPRPYRDSYRAFVSTLPLDAALRLVTSDPDSLQPPGAWVPHGENPLDAFGSGGTYDRWKISRLFGSRQPTVARGPRGTGGVVNEMWTLVSPYPSSDLTRLEPGTLLIVLRVP